MDYLLLIKASIIGLSIAAPVGPIGLLCMQRTLLNGSKVGFSCGLGAASADALYGAVGALGLTTVTQMFTSLSVPLAFLGGFFLLWLGLQLMRTKPEQAISFNDKRLGMFTAFFSTMALTLANPMTILSFIAVFSALGGSIVLSLQTTSVMILGVFLGSAAWWLMLTLGVSIIRHKINPLMMRKINKAAGALLISFGGWQLISLTL